MDNDERYRQVYAERYGQVPEPGRHPLWTSEMLGSPLPVEKPRRRRISSPLRHRTRKPPALP